MAQPPTPADVLWTWEELAWIDIRAGIRVCALAVDPLNFPAGSMVLAIDYAAEVVVPPHYHTVGHLEVVLSGTLYVSGRAQPPMSIRKADPGYEYGPIETRESPCRVLEFFPEMTAENVTGKFDPAVLAAAGRTEADLRATAALVGLV